MPESEILKECEAAYRANLSIIMFPIARIDEFISAALSNRWFPEGERERFREACFKGEARAYGIPVAFIVDR